MIYNFVIFLEFELKTILFRTSYRSIRKTYKFEGTS